MNKQIVILQHTVSYYYEEEQEMPEHEQEHVQQMIIQGYNQGELNDITEDDRENSGRWQIIK